MTQPTLAISHEAPVPPLAQAVATSGIPALAFLLGALWLPVLPLVAVLLLWIGFGIVAGMPLAANAAAARAHTLRKTAASHPAYGLLGGGVVRVLVCSLFGTIGAAILMVALAGGGVAAWLGALAGAGMAFAVIERGGTLAARLNAPVHDAARLRRWAILWGAGAAFGMSVLARAVIGLPEPALAPESMTALVAEALAAQQLVQGMVVWALGAASAVGLLPPWGEVLLAAGLLGISGVTAATLMVAGLMPRSDWRRAVARASDAPEPPEPQRAAFWTLAVLGAALFGAGLWAETTLMRHAPDARPVAQGRIAVERIGTVLYPSGTHARIIAGREALAVQDAAVLGALRSQTEAAFAAMAGQVDPFLDDYYSLRADYVRLGVALGGLMGNGAEAALAAHLGDRLAAQLGAEEAFAAIAELPMLQALEAQAEAQLAEERALLAGSAAMDVNPARIAVVAEFPALAAMPDPRSAGFSTALGTRLGGSVALGAVGALVAQRVVVRLARQGVLRLGARAMLATVPLIGTLIFIGSDAAALALEEHLNRDDFRAEILEALERQRDALLALMADPVAEPAQE